MVKVGIAKDHIFLSHFVDYPHPESPERLAAIYQMLDAKKSLSKLEKIPLRRATAEEIGLNHSPAYYKQIEETAKQPFSTLDGDTYACSTTFEAAMYAAGSCIEATEKVVRGKLDSAFAFVRPPGHHSEKDRAMGFCIFNNIAIAAKYALEKLDLKKIAIVDFDLHHGNGTQNSFYESDQVLFISTHQYPYYPGSGSLAEIGNGKGEGFTINLPLPPGYGDAEYLKIFKELINPILDLFNPELILVSAGFDIYKDDPLGGMKISKEGFRYIGDSLKSAAGDACKGKTVYFLEGGYSSVGLREGSLAILESLLDENTGSKTKEIKLPENLEVIDQLLQYIKPFWKI